MSSTTTPPSETINRSFIIALIVMGIVEVISTIALIVAMPMKYMMDMPVAVSITGALHGALCVILILMFIVGKRLVPLTTGMTLLGIVGAIIPFGPVFVDLKLARILKTAS